MFNSKKQRIKLLVRKISMNLLITGLQQKIAKSRNMQSIKCWKVPKICGKPWKTGIVTPATAEMSIYHCPHSTALEKGFPWNILYIKNKTQNKVPFWNSTPLEEDTKEVQFYFLPIPSMSHSILLEMFSTILSWCLGMLWDNQSQK